MSKTPTAKENDMTTTRTITEPIVSLEGKGERPSYIYTNEFGVLVRLTRADYRGITEEWDFELNEYPSLGNQYDDGFRYIGTIPRECARVIISGYLGVDGE